MKVHSCAAFFVLAFAAGAQPGNEIRFSGIAINTTNPDKPLAASIDLSVKSGQCKLTVSPPLDGSGPCRITNYVEASGAIEIISDGPPAIVWSGTIKGNLATGTYTIPSGHQSGSFYLALSKPPAVTATPPPPPQTYVPPRSSCSPAIESSISGDFNGFDGDAVFKLQNGQIWEQAEYEYDYEYAFQPDVTIYETSGGCKMKVEDMDETVLVKRVK